MKPFGFQREAREEVLAAARFYAAESPSLAGRFLDEMDSLIRSICAAPNQFRVIDPPCRRALGSTFPYALAFIDQSERIWIVAVAHLKRRPGYWKDRIRL